MMIRRGGPDDEAAVLGLFDEAVAWLTERGSTGQWGTEPFSTQPSRVESIRRFLTAEPWVAEEDGVPVGVLILGDQHHPYVPPPGEPEVYVLVLVTSRAYSGRGIGRALLDHARERAREKGVELVRVDCYAGGGGDLVRFYTGAGFTPTRTFTVGEWPGQLLEARVSR